MTGDHVARGEGLRVLPGRADVDLLRLGPLVLGADRIGLTGSLAGEGATGDAAVEDGLDRAVDREGLQGEGEVGLLRDLVDDAVVADLVDRVDRYLGVGEPLRLPALDNGVSCDGGEPTCLDGHVNLPPDDGLEAIDLNPLIHQVFAVRPERLELLAECPLDAFDAAEDRGDVGASGLT